MEPFFVAQTGEDLNREQARLWIAERTKDAAAEGASWARVSYSDEPRAILFEAWKERPPVVDGVVQEGAPRWAFVAA